MGLAVPPEDVPSFLLVVQVSFVNPTSHLNINPCSHDVETRSKNLILNNHFHYLFLQEVHLLKEVAKYWQ